MKKLLALALALVMVLSLAACGGDTGKTPSGTPENPGESQPQGGGDAPDNAEDLSAAAGEVTVKGEKVIHTTKDGSGNTSVMEYIYDGDMLSKIVLTMQCKDSGAAKNLYEQMMGDAKAMTEQTYSNVELDGKNVICTMNEGMVNTFISFSQDDLAALLRNESTNTSTDSESKVISKTWSEIPLPSGFPKLAEGVTAYTQVEDNIISLEWNVMTIDEVNAMLPAIESWAGAKFEAYGDATYMNWSLSTDTHYISIAYSADHSFMSQVVMSISVW